MVVKENEEGANLEKTIIRVVNSSEVVTTLE